MEELQGSPRRVRSASISSMSQLLLQGWAMLADCCPDCGVPLMRSPDGTQLLCTNCGGDATAGAAPSAPAEAPAAAAQPPQANGTGDHDYSSDESSEGLLQPPQSLRTRLQSAAAGDAAAPRPPIEPAASALQQLPVPAPGLVTRLAAAERGARPSSTGHDPSKAIAELLMEGWALLEEYCPRCLSPLVRSRNRQRIYCAGCRLDVVREGEQPGRFTSVHVAAGAEPVGGSNAATAAAGLPATTIAGGATAAGALSPLAQHAAVVEAAAAAVAARLSAASAALPTAAAERAAQLLSEVRLCAAALQALVDARTALGGPSTTA